jgi:hypothetical protein
MPGFTCSSRTPALRWSHCIRQIAMVTQYAPGLRQEPLPWRQTGQFLASPAGALLRRMTSLTMASRAAAT